MHVSGLERSSQNDQEKEGEGHMVAMHEEICDSFNIPKHYTMAEVLAEERIFIILDVLKN